MIKLLAVTPKALWDLVAIGTIMTNMKLCLSSHAPVKNNRVSVARMLRSSNVEISRGQQMVDVPSIPRRGPSPGQSCFFLGTPWHRPGRTVHAGYLVNT